MEDDFLLLANEGKPALEEVEEEKTEFENKGVVIVEDEEQANLDRMREKFKQQLGIGDARDEDEA